MNILAGDELNRRVEQSLDSLIRRFPWLEPIRNELRLAILTGVDIATEYGMSQRNLSMDRKEIASGFKHFGEFAAGLHKNDAAQPRDINDGGILVPPEVLTPDTEQQIREGVAEFNRTGLKTRK